ncbi:biotin--[acetyl-CoA-carboxylase] ligase [Clostridium sp. C105KSO13]|uniref:biotin--[acetyl-CoA-carboxylase] ligase n=1 Tax=Clostridium sp. C105KSO13 TaxID=1776045 RepID=UPI0007405B60|nr:biotin--[acetyl-CoA-carboxylase] ligase [Clostridium sp. C105KSO13]CUX31815.1 Bifunctional ligase/repressor BirA [Clostridium sp. C105KSO13]
MKAQILRMLRESGGFVSGQQLCEVLGVSRTAVWKAVNQLKEEGYQVEAVRNRGYHIVDSPDILTGEELSSTMDAQWAGKKIYYFDEIDSTNTRAKQLGEEGALHGTIVVAEEQSAGRGRRGRAWKSPIGSNIYMSILLRPEDIPPVKAPMLTLVMGLSTAEGLREYTSLDIQIKWPNDIILEGKKLAGILTEMSTEVDFINYIVIGTGINVNMKQLPAEVAEKATSLRLETGRFMRRSEIIAIIMKKFEKNYQIFMENKDLGQLQEKYNNLLITREKEVRIIGTREEYGGYALGINEKGELMVRKSDGAVETVSSGEVSVRGICGYV